jgi:hypothetical protein
MAATRSSARSTSSAALDPEAKCAERIAESEFELFRKMKRVVLGAGEGVAVGCEERAWQPKKGARQLSSKYGGICSDN